MAKRRRSSQHESHNSEGSIFHSEQEHNSDDPTPLNTPAGSEPPQSTSSTPVPSTSTSLSSSETKRRIAFEKRFRVAQTSDEEVLSMYSPQFSQVIPLAHFYCRETNEDVEIKGI